MRSKYLYSTLFQKKYSDPLSLINEIANDKNHIFWGCAKDFARNILKKSSWSWVVHNIDDYGLLVQKDMPLKKWILWAEEGKGALAKKLTNTYDLISWLLKRYVNSIKNLFDSRYKNHIQPLIFIPYDERNLYDHK